MAQKNKSIDGKWKDLQAARNKTAEDKKKEQALEDELNVLIHDEIMKEVTKTVGSEEDLINLADGLKNGQVKISFIWENGNDNEESNIGTDMYRLNSEDIESESVL